MAGRGGDEGGRSGAEPVARMRQVVPFDDFRRGLGEQLALRIRGGDDARVDAGIQPPLYEHRDQCGLADAVAGSASNAARGEAGFRIAEMTTDDGHDLLLPGARARDAAQHAFTPGVHQLGVAGRIVREVDHAVDQLLAIFGANRWIGHGRGP